MLTPVCLVCRHSYCWNPLTPYLWTQTDHLHISVSLCLTSIVRLSHLFFIVFFFFPEAIVVHKAVWTSESLARAVGEEWSVFNLIPFAEGKTDSSQDPVEGAGIFGKWWMMFCSANLGSTLFHYMLQRINLFQLKKKILFYLSLPLN